MDYSGYPINKDVFFAGAEKKCEIMVAGFRYIMKYQKNSEVGMTYSHVSEYLGSHVFQMLGIPVQETFLGTYQGSNVVLLKNFCKEGEILVPFNDVGESTLERDKELYQYSYDEIQQMLRDNSKLVRVNETVERFWDMFVIDALNGNFDRHGGNWGFIKKENKYTIAPVYDNGSCMYPRINSDEKIDQVLRSEGEIEKRIFQFPTSQILLAGRKSSYYDVISSMQFQACNDAVCRIVPRINLDQINAMIEQIDMISPQRALFYKTMYKRRYEAILLPTYQRLLSEGEV